MPGTGSNARLLCASSVGASGDCLAGLVEVPAIELDGGFNDTPVTRDFAVPGAEVGQYGAISIEIRGDVDGDNANEFMTITDGFGGASTTALMDTGGVATGGGGWPEDDVFRRFTNHLSVEVGDIGGGVAGVRLLCDPANGVNFSPTGMPNNWTWQIRVTAGVLL